MSSPSRLAAEKLATMLARSPRWQALCACSTEAAARDRVFLRQVDPRDERRPFAVIAIGTCADWRVISGGAQNFLRASGTLLLELQRDTEAALYDDALAAEYAAADDLEAVIAEVIALSGDDDLLAILRAECVDFGETPADAELSLGRYHRLVTAIEWGDV
jgi:hypothetical protein